MKKDKKYKSVIIGCGKIAGAYDAPGDKNILTHAHAISVHKRTILSGAYDISYNKAKAFSRKWNTIAYKSLRGMLDKVKPEIIYICVPDDMHLGILKMVLDYKPKAVICEKPLATDIEAAKLIVQKYKKNKISLVVNYTRRFDPVIQRIKSDILKRKYGTFINASVIYTKGILHNGSHAIDLLRYFFGEVASCEVLAKNIDYKKEDPTLDAFLKFDNNTKAHFIAADENHYSIFEIDLLFSRKRINLYQFGLKYNIQAVRLDPIFVGYKDLGDRKMRLTDLNHALLNLIDNVIDRIENKKGLLCSGEDAARTQELCEELLNKLKKHKRQR